MVTPDEDRSPTEPGDSEPEPKAPETPVVEAPPKAEAPSPALEQALAQIASLTQQNTKLQNDLRSIQTGSMRQQERDRRMARIEELVEVGNRRNAVLQRALLSGRTSEEVAPELDQIDRDSSEKLSRLTFEESWTKLTEQLREAAEGENGPLFDLANVPPDMAPLVQAWQKAEETRDLVAASNVVAEVALYAKRLERAQAKAPIPAPTTTPTPRPAATPSPQPQPGASDLLTPPSAGGTRTIRDANDAVDALIRGDMTAEEARTRLSEDTKRQLRERYGLAL